MAMHGRPEAKACLLPYEPPEEPNNPVLRGLPLYYGAKLCEITAVSFDVAMNLTLSQRFSFRPRSGLLMVQRRF